MTEETNVNEQIKTEIAAIRQLVQDHQTDKATLDVEALSTAVADLVSAQVTAKLAVAEENRPIRKGELVGPSGWPKTRSLGLVSAGKFEGYQLADAVLLHYLMDRGHQIDNRLPAPSKYLDGLHQQALTATGALTGAELVPRAMASELWADAFLASKITADLGPIPSPTDPFDLPLSWGPIAWRKGVQNTAPTAETPATAKSTLTHTEQIAEVDWSYDLTEDGAMAIMPSLRSDLARSAAEQMDAFVLNADSTDAGTGNINLNDANPPDDSYYLSLGQDGIRHFFLVDHAGQGVDINTTLTDALLRAAIGRLGKYGAMVDRLRMVTNPETYVLSMLGLSNVVTVDKFGPTATVLTGQLASYGGVPVIVSESMLLAGDDGKLVASGASNDEGTIAIYHKDMWKTGFRRELMIEVDRDIKARQFIMVASFRQAVACRGPRTSATTHTAGVIGITY